MIYGIGVDLVNCERFAKILQKFDPQKIKKKFLNLVEISQFDKFDNCNHQANFLAKCFAAKEAFSKAIGLGIRQPISLNKIWISHLASGKPLINLDKHLENDLQQQLKIQIRQIHLSFSDEANQIIAFVIIEF